MSMSQVEKIAQLADSFRQLQDLNKERDRTTAQLLRVCLQHLQPASPFASSKAMRERSDQRRELLKVLPQAIALFEKE